MKTHRNGRFRMWRNMLATGALGLMLAACAGGDRQIVTASTPVSLAQGNTIAVMPFDNLTNSEEAGQVASYLAVSALRATTDLAVQPENNVAQTYDSLANENTATSAVGAHTTVSARQLGEILGVQYVLTGSVSEYGYQYGLREEPSVSMNMRLVDISDGAVVWTASSGIVGQGTFSRDSVSIIAQRLVNHMIAAMSQTKTTK
ncbi:GNA1162 family protein [uncultured Thalassospira sp.]|jgi:TolB-like protein|uniref:GNA1162 family protein n=1 Tax=uncultured Thalassospira sp. TaxID=404382 RepID=UPI0030DB626A